MDEFYEAESMHHSLCIGKQDQLAPFSSGLGGLVYWIILSNKCLSFLQKEENTVAEIKLQKFSKSLQVFYKIPFFT